MKVGGVSGAGQTQASKAPARAQGGFSLGGASQAGAPAQAAPTAGVTGVASIDALLALQSVGSPLERRRRAVRRAGRILDVLDEIKLSLLDGGVTPGALDQLLVALREERHTTDDPKLEGVLNEIETRAAVELAKLEQSSPAA